MHNGKEATVNRALYNSKCPSLKQVHSVFGEINYGGLKHNLGLVLPSGGWQSLIQHWRWLAQKHSSSSDHSELVYYL